MNEALNATVPELRAVSKIATAPMLFTKPTIAKSLAEQFKYLLCR